MHTLEGRIYAYNLTYCSYYDTVSPVGPIIVYLPYSMFFIFTFFTWVKEESYFGLGSMWTWVIWFIACCMNDYLGWERDFPECTLPISSKYAFPCTNNLYMSAVCAVIYSYSGRRYKRGTRRWKRGSILVFSLIYPIAHYVCGLGSWWQGLLSYLIGFVTTVIYCKCVIDRFFMPLLEKAGPIPYSFWSRSAYCISTTRQGKG